MAIQQIPGGGSAGAAQLISALMNKQTPAGGGAGAMPGVSGPGSGTGVGASLNLTDLIGQVLKSFGAMSIPGAGA